MFLLIDYPLKQGLKRDYRELDPIRIQLLIDYPLKQGLKLILALRLDGGNIASY